MVDGHLVAKKREKIVQRNINKIVNFKENSK